MYSDSVLLFEHLFSSGLLKLHLSAETFQLCGQTKPPLNTLFKVETAGEFTYMDMMNHFELIVSLFELCPKGARLIMSDQCIQCYPCIRSLRTHDGESGDFSVSTLKHMFSNIDDSFMGALSRGASRGATLRVKKRWCDLVVWLHVCFVGSGVAILYVLSLHARA